MPFGFARGVGAHGAVVSHHFPFHVGMFRKVGVDPCILFGHFVGSFGLQLGVKHPDAHQVAADAHGVVLIRIWRIEKMLHHLQVGIFMISVCCDDRINLAVFTNGQLPVRKPLFPFLRFSGPGIISAEQDKQRAQFCDQLVALPARFRVGTGIAARNKGEGFGLVRCRSEPEAAANALMLEAELTGQCERIPSSLAETYPALRGLASRHAIEPTLKQPDLFG